MGPAVAAGEVNVGGYAAQKQQHHIMNNEEKKEKEEEEEEEEEEVKKRVLANGPVRLTVILLYFASTVELLTLLIIPSVLFELRAAFALSVFQAGLLTSISSFLGAAFSPIAGYVATYYSRVQIIVVGILCCGLSSLVLGLSQSFLHAAISRAISGLGVCLVSPAVKTMLADAYPKEQRGKGFGFLIMLTAVGGIFGMTGATIIADKSVLGCPGWRMFAFLTATMAFCLAACMHALGLDPVTSHAHLHNHPHHQHQQQGDDEYFRHPPCDRHSQKLEDQLSPPSLVVVASAPSSSQSRDGPFKIEEILSSKTAVEEADAAAAIAARDGRRDVREEEDEEQQQQNLRQNLHQEEKQPRGAVRMNKSDSENVSEEDTWQRQNVRDNDLLLPTAHVAAAAAGCAAAAAVAAGEGGGGGGEGGKGEKEVMSRVRKSSLDKVWSDLRETIAIPSIVVVFLTVAASSIPGRAPGLYTIYFELSQFSHADAASLLLVFGLSSGGGAFLGGCVGDLMSRRLPDAGRVLCGHFSATMYPLLQWWMLRGLPRGGGSHWSSYAAVLCLSGLTGSWSGAGMKEPLLAEVSPPPLLTFVYACDYAVASLVGSIAGPLAGAAAELFGFDAATKKQVDPHPHPNTGMDGRGRMTLPLAGGNQSKEDKDLSDADALSKGVLLTILLPSVINVDAYFFLYWFYPKDRERALSRGGNHKHGSWTERSYVMTEEEEKEEERVGQGDRQPLLRPVA